MNNEQEIARLNNIIKNLEEKIVSIEKERVEYLQNVSHQLVAPLNAIKWHIENLTGDRIGVERAMKVLRSIYSQATLAVHLAKNFNLMSNLEADHALSNLKEPLQEVELLPLLINLADDFQPLSWEKNISIRVDDTNFSKDSKVIAIKPLVSQVFSNIIENATKYSSTNTEIIIQGMKNIQTKSFRVLIKNRGIRLSDDDKKHVFDRGYRSNAAKDKYPAGTGFGLYIAKKIVDIHEGKIGIIDDPTFTIFAVELPIDALRGKARMKNEKDGLAY